MLSSLYLLYEKFCSERRDQAIYRLLQARAQGYEDFSSNDYLGLSQHPLLQQRAQAFIQQWGCGAKASRLLSGTLEIHEELEAKIALQKHAEAALLFNTGFQANLTILPALLDARILGKKPLVLADRLNHASMHLGCQLAGSSQIRYRHLDLNHLEDLLKKYQQSSQPRFILTESIFGMDGDVIDMSALVELAQKYEAFLYVDEAHATGVLGKEGYGLTSAFGSRIDCVVGTFSKALGCFGAYVACRNTLKQYLINRCAGFIYTTALPPALVGSMTAAWELVPSLSAERLFLQRQAKQLREQLTTAGFDCGASTTHIIPILLGDSVLTVRIAEWMRAQRILVSAVRPPSVPSSTSRLRIALTIHHTEQAINKLFSALKEVQHFLIKSPRDSLL